MVGNSWAQIAAQGSQSSTSFVHAKPAATQKVVPETDTHKMFSTHARLENSPMTHRGQDHKSPLIVSLRFNRKILEQLTEIRQQHFPDDNNNLDAHLTILHALPAECREDMQHYLQALADKKTAFRLSLAKVQVKPRIVLLPVRGPELNETVHQIQQQFWDMLSDQDRGTFRQGHITLCNKRSEEEVAARGPEIEAKLHGCERWHCMALGLDLWVYQGRKPWKHVSYYPFKEHK